MKRLTVAELADYLNQFEGDAQVFLNEADVPEGIHDFSFIILENLSYDTD